MHVEYRGAVWGGVLFRVPAEEDFVAVGGCRVVVCLSDIVGSRYEACLECLEDIDKGPACLDISDRNGLWRRSAA